MVCRYKCPHLHQEEPAKTISYSKEDLCIPLLFFKPLQITLYKLCIYPEKRNTPLRYITTLQTIHLSVKNKNYPLKMVYFLRNYFL
jgi:hypothetical protein